jgi:phosphoenolpyruvate-protein phosphotransferase (PTS system enzyme I)
MPVTIRTVDVGADKPLDAHGDKGNTHLNPALGLRAIRWSLSEPAMFRTQLRAILRAAAHGKVNLLIPMLCAVSEIRKTLRQLDLARAELDNRGAAYGEVQLGAMIEIPAAAMSLPAFLQYTLAIDRADESVAHLYDPLHPAVLQLIAQTIAACHAQGKGVSVCGEMAGDVTMTRLLLGMGLRTFSMHPAQVLAVKQEVLRSDTSKLKALAHRVLCSDDPAAELSA